MAHLTTWYTSQDGVAVRARLLEEEGGVVQQPDEVLDRLVRLVRLGLLAEGGDDRVVGVDLERLLGRHVAAARAVAEGLRLHDALHARGPAVLAGDQHAGGRLEAVGDD